MSVTINNNFTAYKSDFKKDTKLDADSNLGLYIQYVIARTSDYNFQLNTHLFNRLNHLSNELGAEVAKVLKKS